VTFAVIEKSLTLADWLSNFVHSLAICTVESLHNLKKYPDKIAFCFSVILTWKSAFLTQSSVAGGWVSMSIEKGNRMIVTVVTLPFHLVLFGYLSPTIYYFCNELYSQSKLFVIHFLESP
jgi:hypothetical protein